MPAASGIVGAGTSLIGGLLGSSAANKAAQQQQASQQNVIANTAANKNESLNRESGLYSGETSALAPYQSAGTGALQQLASGTATGGVFNSTPTSAQVMAQDPGYQFNLDQGTTALQRAEAASGTVGSGGALKAGVQYASDYANNSYQNAYNQFMGTRQNNYNNLLGLAGIGQNANSQYLNATQNYGTTATGIDNTAATSTNNAYTGIGNAQAQGTINAANSWTGALSGLASASTALPTSWSAYGLGGSQPNSGLPSPNSSGYTGGYTNSNGDFQTTQ